MNVDATFTVQPIDVGTLTVHKASLTYMRSFDKRIAVPIIMWLLRNGDDVLVVDTGAHASAFNSSAPYRSQSEAQRPESALAAAGVEPAAVKTVILSHLHYDHAGNCDMFPNAELIVQRRELEYAQAPLPLHRRVFESPALKVAADRWHVVDGDIELRPGIRLLLTPGHTPGLQAVVANTAGGRLVLASDTIPLAANWVGEPPETGPIPTGSFIDLRAYYDTLSKLAGTGGRVLASHDPELFSETWPQ